MCSFKTSHLYWGAMSLGLSGRTEVAAGVAAEKVSVGQVREALAEEAKVGVVKTAVSV